MMRLFQAAGGGADRFLGIRAGRSAGRSWNNKLFRMAALMVWELQSVVSVR